MTPRMPCSESNRPWCSQPSPSNSATQVRHGAQRVAPIAEWVAKALSGSCSQSRRLGLPTLLTQQHRREAKGAPQREPEQPPEPPRICRTCGTGRRRGQRCAGRGLMSSEEPTISIARRPPANEKRRAVMHRRLVSAKVAWKPSDQPAWLTERFYDEQIQPRLDQVSAPRLAAALGVSKTVATGIRDGCARPHPSHWLALAELAGVCGLD